LGEAPRSAAIMSRKRSIRRWPRGVRGASLGAELFTGQWLQDFGLFRREIRERPRAAIDDARDYAEHQNEFDRIGHATTVQKRV
jgi:hypothetical protein